MRSGCLAPAWISLADRPEEDEAIDVGRRGRFNGRDQGMLEVQPLGAALLDEDGVPHGLRDIRREGQPVPRRALGQAERLDGGP